MIRLIQSEWMKARHERSSWMLLLLPALFIFLATLLFSSSNNVMSGDLPDLIIMFQTVTFICLALLYPILIAFYSFTVWRLEYSQNAITKLMTLPYSRYQIGIGKWITMVCLILLSSLVALLVWLISIYIIRNHMDPEATRSLSYHITNAWHFFIYKVFITGVTIGTIHYFLTFFVKGLITTLLIAVVGTLVGLFMLNSDYIDFYPYGTLFNSSISLKLATNTLRIEWGMSEWVNIAYTMLFLFLSLFAIDTNRFKQS